MFNLSSDQRLDELSQSFLSSQNGSILSGISGDRRSADLLNFSPATSASSLVFIDGGITDYQSLPTSIKSGVQVIFLDSSKDGLSQIGAELAKHTNIASVHIVSHGGAGSLQLGNSSVDFQTLINRSDELHHWADALTVDADILLYGCDVAANLAGQAFVRQLSMLTEADVAASTDLTGNAALGGNWTLEFASGAIEANVPFQTAGLLAYGGVLANFNFTNFASVSGLRLNGNAVQATNTLRLTPATANQAGSAFFTTPIAIDANTSFQTSFQFRLNGGNGASGADGFVFMLQNSAAGITALGSPGGGLGYDVRDSTAGSRIVQSLAIEFDTYQNGWDLNGNHISVLQNGDVSTALATAAPSVDLNNGNLQNAWVDYNGITNVLSVFLSTTTTKPTTALLSTTVDLAALINGSSAFAGFSAGTGGLSNAQAITSWNFNSDPKQITLSGPATVVEGATSTNYAVALGSALSVGQSVTFTLDTASGTATEGTDFTALTAARLTAGTGVTFTTSTGANGVITVTATATAALALGAALVNFTLPTLDDPLVEGNETFPVTLASTTATVTNGTVTTTISDNDTTALTLSGPATVVEGATSTNYAVALGSALSVGQSVTFTLDTASGTATEGTDFTALTAARLTAGTGVTFTTSTGANGVITVTATATAALALGAALVNFTLPTLDDPLVEGNETFPVTLASTTATVTNGTVTTTISDNDTTALTLSGPATVVEGATSTNYAVALGSALSVGQSVTFTLDTASGTATEGTDFTALTAARLTAGTGVTFTTSTGANGVITVTATATAALALGAALVNFTLPTLDDPLVEGNETFPVTLASTTATVTNGTVTTTISDNDTTALTLSGPATVVEGATSTNYAVALGSALSVGQSVTFTLDTASGTATEGTDFTALTAARLTAGTGVTFTTSTGANGVITVTATATAALALGAALVNFTLPTLDDPLVEGNETFPVTLASTTATVTNGTVTTTISDNDTNSNNFNFTNFASTSGLQLNGSAAQAGTALRLTPAAGDQAGSAFFTSPITIDANTSFQTQFQFQLSGGTDGADGFIFMLQNSAAGVTALGDPGSSLGYDDLATGAVAPIGRSLGIKFDTYGDANNNSIGVLQNGDVNTALALVTTGLPDLNSGAVLTAWIDYNGGTNRLDVFLSSTTTKPTTAALSYTVDLTAVVGAQAFVGFSAATGGFVNAQDITSWNFSYSTLAATPGVTLTQSGGTTIVTEGGGSDTYTVVLNAAPTAAVTLALTNAAGQTTTNPASITFTTTNWNVPQTITVTAVDDTLVEGTHTGTISHTVTSTDTRYNGLSVAPLSVTINDNDAPSNNFNFTDFASTSGLQLNGSATQAGTVLRLTPALGNQAGSAFFTSPITIDANTSFQTQFQFQLSGGTDGADGFIFMLQNSAAGVTALGDPGSSLGYDDLATGAVAPIGRSLGIKFDTYGDANNNSIGVLQNGDVNTALALVTTGLPDLNSGALVNAWIDYNGGTNRLDVFLSSTTIKPTTAALSYTVDLAAVVGARAFVGFSAATGGFVNAQDITSWSFSSTELSTFSLKDNATIFVSEAAGVATVTAVRTGSTQERLTVEYTTNEAVVGAATAGADYTPPTFGGRANTGQVVFEIGEAEKSFTIPIINDTLIEGNETFSLGLQNPSGGTLGAPRTVLITIVDDDSPVTISVGTAAVAVSEGAPTASITLLRSGNTTGASTVNFNTSNGTAIASSDYTASSGTVTFAAGQTTQTIAIPILNDTISENNETFSVTLSNAGGAVLGSQTTATITILDNDPLGGLTRQTAISGLNQPTTIDWTPDGRYMLVAQKDGVVRVIDNGVLRSTPLIDLSAQVNEARDRGLLGMAIHPNFPSTPYIYLLYTYDPPEAIVGGTGLNGTDQNGNRPSRLVRLTVNPATMIADPASLVVLAGTNSTWAYTSRPDGNSTGDLSILPSGIVNGTTINPAPGTVQIDVGVQDNDPDRPGIQNQNIRDYLATDSESHSIGAVHFGADGYLYLSNGDGTSYNFADPRAVRVQDIDNLSGKVLRIDPITGQGVAGNPFYEPTDPNSNQSKVFYSGVRNAFRFTFDPVTNLPVIGDVGWYTWEEINTGPAGSNFGWPYLEGPGLTSVYSDLPQAVSFYNNGNINPGSPSTQPAVFPILSRSHGAPDTASAIVVGDFYNTNTLMFGDLINGNLYAATLDINRQITNVQVFDSNIPYVVDMEMGPDGTLYGADLVDGTILRWVPA